MARSNSTTSTSRQPLALFAAIAILGQVILLGSALLLPLVSEFSFVGDTMSELVLGRFGWVQSAAIVAAGIGALALAYALGRLTAGIWGSRVGSLLVGLYGVGALLIAIFPTDRVDSASDVWSQSTSGTIHLMVSLVSFVGMIVGMFVLSRTFLLDAHWRSLFPWSSLLPAAALSLLIGQSQGPWVGIMQRLLVGAIATWIVLVALRVRSIVAAGEPRSLHPAHAERAPRSDPQQRPI